MKQLRGCAFHIFGFILPLDKVRAFFAYGTQQLDLGSSPRCRGPQGLSCTSCTMVLLGTCRESLGSGLSELVETNWPKFLNLFHYPNIIQIYHVVVSIFFSIIPKSPQYILKGSTQILRHGLQPPEKALSAAKL